MVDLAQGFPTPDITAKKEMAHHLQRERWVS